MTGAAKSNAMSRENDDRRDEEEKYAALKAAIEKAEESIRMGNVIPIEVLPSYERYRRLKARLTGGDL